MSRQASQFLINFLSTFVKDMINIVFNLCIVPYIYAYWTSLLRHNLELNELIVVICLRKFQVSI